jgi:hypothetical protein
VIKLNELVHLRSLSLINLTENNVQQLLPMLSFLSNLYSFSVFDLKTNISKIISSLPKTNLRILSVACFMFTTTSLYQITELTSLTILSSSLYDLFQLFKYAPMLKYLKIEIFQNSSSKKDDQSNMMIEDAVHLKEFIIDDRAVSCRDLCEGCTANFEDLQVLLKHMPNLKILSICFTWSHRDLYDADRWENLLKLSSQHLSVFRFFFSYHYDREFDEEYSDLKKFQNDFWSKRHLYTTYTADHESPSVYTIPYITSSYTLTPKAIRCNNSVIDKSNEFDNVKQLTLLPALIKDNSEYYFRNVESLRLTSEDCDYESNDRNVFKLSQIKFLDKLVNLSNIKHLSIDEDCDITKSAFLYLMKGLPSLSSLTIDEFKLIRCLNEAEVCEYLDKKIIKLDICDHWSDTSINSNQMTLKFCQMFSNVQQLTHHYMTSVDDLLLILTACSKLSILKIRRISKQIHSWIEANASILNVYLSYESIAENENE